MTDKVSPRSTPERDARYMGEAWYKAAFSKDPNTQVGSVIVSDDNDPLGSGYNGPPKQINDFDFSWERAPKDDPDAFSKNDIIVHAEVNAMDRSPVDKLIRATIYVTALPCPHCMLEIVRKRIRRVVYFDYQSSPNSSLQNSAWREKSFRIAQLGHIQLDQFTGNLNWLRDWNKKLEDLGVYSSCS